MLISTDPAPTHRTPAAGTAGAAEGAVRERIAALHRLLGDPADAANPFGHRALLDADARGEPLPGADAAAAGLGLGAEFVPVALGGRLDRMDRLVRVLRAVFRRGAALGIGHGAAPLLAALPVWAAGTARQRRWTADLLLDGGTLAVAHHRLAHGDDFVRGEFEAVPHRGGHVLDGRKPAVLNAARADALVIFGRTSPADGPRSHSVLLADTASLPTGRFTRLPRRRSVGLRACDLGGLEFDACPVPGDALVGRLGEGVELALRSFQIARAAVPGMVLGGGDTALRTAVRHALHGPPGEDAAPVQPQHRATLARAFATLLVCDCLTLVAGRTLHLLPEQSSLPAAVTAYLVPRLLRESAYDLSAVLGARFHSDEGAYGVLRTYLRDLPLTSLGYAGSAACQATIVPQLPGLARRSWLREDAPPWDLFATGGELPALDVGRAALSATVDPPAAALVAVERLLHEGGGPSGGPQTELCLLRELARGLVGELSRLREELRTVPAGDRTALANPRTYALADRYALVAAGGACLGVWHAHRDVPGSFLAEPAWLVEALMGIAQRLGLPLPKREVPTAERVVREVLDRYHSARGYDLYGDDL